MMTSHTALRAVRPLLSRRVSEEVTSALQLGSRVPSRRLAAIAPPSLSYLPLPAHAPPAPVSAPLLRTPKDEADDSLFRYTSGRWLYNEAEQMAQRYIKFDVDALHRVIFDVCGSPVVGMEKKEGLFNKSFMCTLGDGQQVTARIKNPIAGPAHLMTASEVATMDYVRNYLGVPAPKVLAWSSRAGTNGIGAEYILMETAAGVQLGDVWHAPSMDARKKKDVVNALIGAEQKMLEARFGSYGSLYYKGDVPEADRAPELYADDVVGARREDGSEARFCIGPTANRNFYEDERATMDVNRGPWSSPSEYLCALALKEEAWIGAHAKPNVHDDPFRAVAGAQTPAEHIAVLQQYRAIAPALVPTDARVTASVLWHPDLNPGNVFITKAGELTSVIDWQGAWAGPLYLQMNTPAFVAYTGPDLPSGAELPVLPETFNRMHASRQEVVRKDHRAKMLHKLYEIKQLLPFKIGAKETRVMPVRAAGRTWKDGILPLQLALLEVVTSWPSLSTPDVPCPLKFTRDDVQALVAKRDRYCEWHSLLDDLRLSFGMRLYGWVPPGEYGSKKELLGATRGALPEGLTREMDAIVPGEGWWPFRDTVGASKAVEV